MSLQTTEARAAAAHAAHGWRQHLRYCGPCHRRDYCPEGTGLRGAVKAAEAELARQRQLDQAPAPGQQALL